MNYHAIGVYTALQGGFALHNPQEEASLKVSAFVLHPTTTTTPLDETTNLDTLLSSRSASYPHLVDVFNTHLVNFGPNDFFMLQKALKEKTATPSLHSILALLKLSFWDADLFHKFREIILESLATCGSKLRHDLLRGLPLIWKNYYQLDSDKDIAFEIGRVYYGIQNYQKSLEYYQISIEIVGQHPVTSHNIGLCYYSMKDLEKALPCFEMAVDLNGEYEKAKIWRERTRRELKKKNEEAGMGVGDIALTL